jgi:hypothetical protein
MSITLLTVFVLLVGVVTYLLLKRLVTGVRVVASCVLMVFLAAFVAIGQNREMIAHQKNSSVASRSPTSADERPLNIPNPGDDPRGEAYVNFERVSKEDHNFLDEILQKPSQDGQKHHAANRRGLKADLALNTSEAKHSEQVTRKETVKRAQLVIHNETLKHSGLVRSIQ